MVAQVIPIDSRGRREARAFLASVDPIVLANVTDMARKHNVVGTAREADYAAALRQALIELKVPVGNVAEFVAAFLEEVRSGSPF